MSHINHGQTLSDLTMRKYVDKERFSCDSEDDKETVDDKTFQYTSHMNKNKRVPDKWPLHNSKMITKHSSFTNEHITNSNINYGDRENDKSKFDTSWPFFNK